MSEKHFGRRYYHRESRVIPAVMAGVPHAERRSPALCSHLGLAGIIK